MRAVMGERRALFGRPLMLPTFPPRARQCEAAGPLVARGADLRLSTAGRAMLSLLARLGAVGRRSCVKWSSSGAAI